MQMTKAQLPGKAIARETDSKLESRRAMALKITDIFYRAGLAAQEFGFAPDFLDDHPAFVFLGDESPEAR